MLSTNEKNCPLYAEKITPALKEISAKAETELKKSYPDVAKMIAEKKVSVNELCSYLQWAYYNSIELEGDEDQFQ